MKKTNLLKILLLLLLPAGVCADDRKPSVNIDDCIVESVEFAGVDESLISRVLREEAQSLVGKKYDARALNKLANKLRGNLTHDYNISINNTVNAGDKPDYVRVVIRAEKFDQRPEVNVNERYIVESIEFAGVDESRISRDLREEAQKFVAQKYNAQAAEEFARKLHEELQDKQSVTRVEVKVHKGGKPDCIKLEFRSHKKGPVDLQAPIFLYHSKQGFSGALDLILRIDKTQFTFGIVSEADTLLERNAGLHVSFEQKSLGTDILGFRIDFDSYHQSFNQATIAALDQRPDVPYFYRARQNFAPSLSVRPMKNLTMNVGLSFQRLQHQYPSLHTETAYAGTGDIRYSRKLSFLQGYQQNVTATYGVRTATRVLDSNYIYTRHLWTADYELSKGKSTLLVHFRGGIFGGTAPLFERFSLGNSATLRGWNKFDVAPIGGSRMAHGSLEYRYRTLEVFYDVGTVWDPGQYNPVRHGLGFGLVSRKKHFISLAFPVRLRDVAPIFMVGHRF